jgi:predicted GNAT superfamily acetyltransferase
MRAAVTETVVRPLVAMDDLTRASALLAEIWGYPPAETPVSAELLRALVYAGNYVAGAWRDDQLIGASAGFVGLHDGAIHLHSHISGVAPDHQGSSTGYALKQHQREWALDRDIPLIEWTFDPLVRRNAYFNLTKLGAVVVAYESNFYGAMRDAFNAGEETDRAIVQWDIVGESRPAVESASAPAILYSGADGRPGVDGSAIGEVPVLRAWIPEDHLALRGRDAALALAWRRSLRDTVGRALTEGYRAVAMTRDGWYTLVRET